MYLQPYGDDQQLNLNWIINEIINLHKQLDPDYETPSFTQIYPYSNLNRLNLDWVLSELKALKELAPEPAPALDIQAVAEALVALPFDRDTPYQIYDFISRDGEIWRATEAIAAGGEWDSTKWFKTKLGTDLAVLERWINAINNSLTTLQNTVGNLSSINISDDSDAGGATVKASLNNLKGSLDSVVIIGNNTDLSTIGSKSAILKGTFTLSTLFTMADNQALIGADATVTVINNARIQMGNNCIIDNINFVGSWNANRTQNGTKWVPLVSKTDLANGTTAALWGDGNRANVGILNMSSGKARGSKIVNCTFQNIQKCCIACDSGNHLTVDGWLVSGNKFTDCWMGIAALGEFGIISDNNFFRVIVGIYVLAGNISKSANVLKGCDCGIYWQANSANGGHGETTGCEIAHCGCYGIFIKLLDARIGDVICGCHIADAPVVGETVNGFRIIGCRLDTYFAYTSGTNNSIIGNNIRNAYLDGNPLFAVPNDTEIYDNTPLGTATWDDVNPIHTHFVTFTTGSGLTGTANGIFDPRTCTVRVRGYIYMAENITTSKVLFTAPDGFRPTSNFPIFMECTMENGSTVPYFGTVKQNGEITQNLGNTVQKILLTGEYPTHSS